MLRIVWSQIIRRWTRSVALLVGLLVAVTSFTVLTGTAETARLDVIGTVEANARTAYDILVRPAESISDQETATGVVRPNFLTEAPGGISLEQVDTIRSLSGVEVAAPIALIGMAVPELRVPVDLSDVVPEGERSAFRLTVDWRMDRGLSTIGPDEAYIYFTPNPVAHRDIVRVTDENPFGSFLDEILPSGARVNICGKAIDIQAGSSEESSFTESVQCYSLNEDSREYADQAFLLDWRIPYVLAAIDPAAEAELIGLDDAMVSGSYLPDSRAAVAGEGDGWTRTIPVIAASDSYVDQQAIVEVEKLPRDVAEQFIGTRESITAADSFAASASGVPVKSIEVDGGAADAFLLRDLGHTFGNTVGAYWTAGPVEWDTGTDGALIPRDQEVASEVWQGLFGGRIGTAPIAADDRSFRELQLHGLAIGRQVTHPKFTLTGRFDPELIDTFSALSEVPLGAYQSPGLEGADETSQRLLGGAPLLPSSNPAGYLQQPPLLLTTLDSAESFYGSFDRSSGPGPVAAVRVRVAGVTGIDEVSRERVRVVAERIAQETGLHVDITVGSSPTKRTVALPAGEFGRPDLSLTEWWSKKGVGVVISEAVERKSLILFVLVLVVCALFIGNSSAAAVRARRTELGVLACLGWPRRSLFAVILGELLLIGLVAGALGAVAAWLVAVPVGADVSWSRAVLAVPAAILVSLAAGLIPAVQASRADPMAAVRPPVVAGRRARLFLGLTGLAVVNLRRAPGRTALGCAALAVAVTALTLLVAITWAFQGVLVGSLLGDAIAVQVRGPDLAAVVAMLVLATVAIADVVFLNVRERAAEFAALQATGWTHVSTARLVLTEGVLLGLLGAVPGAVLGLGLAVLLAGGAPEASLARLLPVAAIVAGVGVLAAAVATVPPIQSLRRHPVTRLLVEE
ncbi:FtsX-like permease family protein [Solwaraspora sp. WMMD937]|uniref:FtsX-like permease family protein n=1 Tax=Solwaraspora sp. WMMD937 TaxID=3016090 RepID=UPI00249A137C|nr:FtsX-like permease family protein [Solwaraspora sp. WMMD937]WFE22275.1 FtsX-like permease family protein [Solwaraspora sp. WMMD937]